MKQAEAEMRRAKPQRTADRRRVEPTPRMAEPIVWVVDTGTPSRLAASMTVAAAVSAAKPWIGRSSTTRKPMVRMMRQPPIDVPRPIAVAAVTMIQAGTCQSLPPQCR